CRTLESIYRDSNHSEEAAKYADLAGRYEQRAGVVSAVPFAAPVAATAEFEIAAPVVEHTDEAADAAAHPAPAAVVPQPAAVAPPPVAAKATTTPNGVFFHSPTAVPETPAIPEPPPVVPEPQAAAPAPVTIPEAPVPTVEAEPAVAEVSGEWEQDLEVDAPHAAPAIEEATPAAVHAAPEPEPAETQAAPEIEAIPEAAAPVSAIPRLNEGIEEVRFYLGQGMVEQAEQALAKLEALAPDSPELA